ncbi:MAG: hypothetical protein ACI8UO_000709 [Verrucomicrobiales bacterium]|jgi:hypothetical protein
MAKMRTIFLILIVFAPHLNLAQEPEPAAHLDRPAFEAGREYVTRHSQHTEVTLENGEGAKQVVDLTLVLTSACRKAKGEADREVVTAITSLSVNLNVGGAELRFDSGDPTSARSPLKASFGELVGRKFTVHLDESGKAINLGGLDEFAAGEANPLGQQFGQEQLQQLLAESVDLGLAAEGISAGKQWLHEATTQLPPAGVVRTAFRFRYSRDEAIGEAECARLDCLGVLSFTLESGGSGEAIETEDGTLRGVVWIDKDLGFPRKSSANLKMTVKMPNPVRPGELLEMPVAQKIEMELISTRKLGLLGK